MQRFLVIVLFFCLILPAVYAGEGNFPDIKVRGLVDLRVVTTDDTVSFSDKGLGKTRYGGDEAGGSRTRGELAEAALVLFTRFSWDFTGHLKLKYDPDQRHSVDVLEGFIAYRPVTLSSFGFKSRAGIFFPPVSLENKGLAWTSPYTITPSAINSWIGEEVRTVGAEFTALHEGEDNRVSLTGAIYKANDPAGSLLAYRGWAMHDRKPTAKDRVPLAPIASIQSGSAFEKQAPWVEPFTELDGRWGYYAAVRWDHLDNKRFHVLYYDNRADPSVFDGRQYAWHTRFTNIGIRFELDDQWEILSQYMKGDSRMGLVAGVNAVKIDFSAYYVLVSKRLNKHRFSLRYDNFDIEDIDNGIIVANDHNQEDGDAWTLAYTFRAVKKHLIILEALKIDSKRFARTLIGLPENSREVQLQISYRIFL